MAGRRLLVSTSNALLEIPKIQPRGTATAGVTMILADRKFSRIITGCADDKTSIIKIGNIQLIDSRLDAGLEAVEQILSKELFPHRRLQVAVGSRHNPDVHQNGSIVSQAPDASIV